MELSFQNPFEWQRIGEVLRIRGPGLQEGLWTDKSHQTIFYPRDVIQEAAQTAIGAQITFKHRDIAEAVGGFVTAVKRNDGGISIEGIVFDRDLVAAIESKKFDGISPEADVATQFNEAEKRNEAAKLKFTRFAMVENPACEPCRVESSQRIRMGKMEIFGHLKKDSEGGVFLEIAPKPREEENWKMSSEIEGAQKPSREDFFKWVEDQLKKADVEADDIKKVTDVLKAAIKVPYPYPYPAPYPKPRTKEEQPESIEALMEAFEKLFREKFSSEMAKPTKAAFLRWLRQQFKEAGFETADIGKILDVIRKAVKTPYPYPYPAAKVKGETASLDEIWDETVEGLENQVNALTEEKEKKEQEIEKVKRELDLMKTAENKRKEDEINALSNSIKEIDSSFDATKFLEGITCLDTKRSVLSRYLETVKRLSPAIQLAGVQAVETGEEKAKKVTMAMFGTDEFAKLFPEEAKPSGGK